MKKARIKRRQEQHARETKESGQRLKAVKDSRDNRDRLQCLINNLDNSAGRTEIEFAADLVELAKFIKGTPLEAEITALVDELEKFLDGNAPNPTAIRSLPGCGAINGRIEDLLAICEATAAREVLEALEYIRPPFCRRVALDDFCFQFGLLIDTPVGFKTSNKETPGKSKPKPKDAAADEAIMWLIKDRSRKIAKAAKKFEVSHRKITTRAKVTGRQLPQSTSRKGKKRKTG